MRSSGSYKLTEFILKEIKYDSCEIIYASTIILSISGGFLALKIFHLLNFILGLLTGSSIGYIVYISGLNKICLGFISFMIICFDLYNYSRHHLWNYNAL